MKGLNTLTILQKKRRKKFTGTEKTRQRLFQKIQKKEYKEKYDFYTKEKGENYGNSDSARKIKDLERQIESVKDHKSMLRKELNLKEIRACNSTLRKIYKKIYDCYVNTDILYHERYNYEVLALGLDILE